MKQLSHNGVMVPKYEPKDFHILFRGKKIALTPRQEEMAVAWVKKLGTEYVEDPVFVKNFFSDFCKALGIEGKKEDFDFSEIENFVEKERNDKLSMSKGEKKKLAQERKIIREANREKYGYAMVDGERVEVSNYVVEPGSIFMGRGKHPLRGKWKQGAKESDIILNLSPDAPIPKSFFDIANHCQMERFINKYSHCNSGDEVFCRLIKLNGQKNITSTNIEKLKKIQDFMRSFLKNTGNGKELIEILEKKLGENGLKNSKKIQKSMQNITEGKQSKLDFIESSDLERVLTTLEKLTLSKNMEGNVNSVETAISEFLSFITEPHLIENFLNSERVLTIGEILERKKICKYCVVIAIGLFTCLGISINMPWKQVSWNQNLWIAKWDDKLRGKEKYVWLSDTSKVKQEREKEKFDKAGKLAKEYGKVKKHINDNLNSPDLKTRKVATVCYLIDALSLRVGDEKDEDEADTVGATTLTSKNVKIEENLVKFDFLGKDSVRWQKDVELSEQVIKNLKEFISQSKSEIFEGIRSENVNEFLSTVVPGISAKVFRTYHASKIVDEYLKKEKVSKTDADDYKKYVATMANLQAAIVCNHKRKLPAKWNDTLQKKVERLKELKEKKGKKTAKRVKTMELKIKLMKKTKDYNLNTSLKSYIDPRFYYKWSKRVEFDWKKYYPKTLQRKFSWIEEN